MSWIIAIIAIICIIVFWSFIVAMIKIVLIAAFVIGLLLTIKYWHKVCAWFESLFK